MESDHCKHCGACRCHERCSCCGCCRKCGQYIALSFVWPYPITPYTVPYTVPWLTTPWLTTSSPFINQGSGSTTGVNLNQVSSSSYIADPNMQTSFANGTSVSLIQ